MNSNNNWNIPKGKAAKAAVLAAIMRGDMKIDDLKEPEWKVTLDLNDDAHTRSHLKPDKDTIYVTLNLS